MSFQDGCLEVYKNGKLLYFNKRPLFVTVKTIQASSDFYDSAYDGVIHKNTRQSNDVDGSIGYIMPGLGHECCNFTSQTLESPYHWLPWCTYVEVDPSSRLYDTFGGYEIADAQRLSPEERARRNRIYDTFA